MDSKSWTIRKTNSPIIITAIHNGHEIRSDLGDYIGLSSDSGTETKKLQLVEDRLINKRIMSQYVINMLRLHVNKNKE